LEGAGTFTYLSGQCKQRELNGFFAYDNLFIDHMKSAFSIQILTITGFTTCLQDPIVSIAPKKPNWDLRRDVAKKLEKLEKRTQRAIVELMSKCSDLQLETCIRKRGLRSMWRDIFRWSHLYDESV
jgi:hypothetical protein